MWQEVSGVSGRVAGSTGVLQDGKKPGQSRPQTGSNCHFGCILTLQRSPFLPHIVLSAGGYDWALYQDHFLEAPLMRSPYAPVQYTCASWSPTRPGDNPKIPRASVSTTVVPEQHPGPGMQVI